MSSVVSVPFSHTKIIRNSRILMAVYACLSVAGYFITLGTALVGLAELTHLRSGIFLHSLNALLWCGSALGLYFCSRLLWTLGTRTWGDRVELTPAGVHFYYRGPSKKREEWFTEWPKISRIAVRRATGQVLDYILTASDGDSFVFNSYSFTRAYTIAKQISLHSGIPLSEATPADPK
jgi:hypothetical protein